MRVTSSGSETAHIRDLYRSGSIGAQPAPRVAEPDRADSNADQRIRRIEMTPQISEYMVRIYNEHLEATGSEHKAAEAVKNSDVFRSFLKRHDLDVVTMSVAASALIDEVIKS